MRAVALLVLTCLVGCAAPPYQYATGTTMPLTLRLKPGEPQVEVGKPNAFVDGIGNYFFSLPSKLLLLSWNLDNHDIDPATVETLETYLRANGLCDVKVRINQYAPGAQWSRLFRNREMPAFWRYTLGVLSVAIYTIFPERAFAGFPLIGGGDHYNPFTNTVSIYSNLKAVALHEGGHAKDFALKTNRHWKGGYAALRILPLVPLWQELVASNDAMTWMVDREDSAVEKSGYRKLYPAYGTYVGGEAGDWVALFTPWVWLVYAVQFGVVVVGHIIGQTAALFVADRPAPNPIWYTGEFAPPDECPPRDLHQELIDAGKAPADEKPAETAPADAASSADDASTSDEPAAGASEPTVPGPPSGSDPEGWGDPHPAPSEPGPAPEDEVPL